MLKRKAPAQTQRKKKISLPAALFNRSPLKNTQNSSFISNTSFTTDPPCQNHPNKKGKYTVVSEQIEEDQQTFYCEKCAILLASKGFEVKKLELPQGKPSEKKKANPREEQLKGFIKDVQELIRTLKESKKQSSEQLNQVQQVYEGKMQKIEIFFEELYTTLQKHKNKQIHQVILQKKSAEEQLATYLGYATEKIELLQAMKQDVISSRESIIHETPEEDYQLVMSHYQSNLTEVKAEPVVQTNGGQDLPSIQTLQCMIAELFNNGQTGTYFSFDSSTKKPYE